jgi:hypothetical protein
MPENILCSFVHIAFSVGIYRETRVIAPEALLNGLAQVLDSGVLSRATFELFKVWTLSGLSR